GTLTGDVCPRAHRDAHIRLHQGGSVVDTIADHGGHPAALDQALDPRLLSFGQQFGGQLVDAELRGHRLGYVPRLTGEKDGPDADRLEATDGRLRFRANRARDADRAQVAPASGDQYRRTSATVVAGILRRCDLAFAKECPGARYDLVPVNACR